MAQTQEPVTGQKRSLSKPTKTATPLTKKPRLSTSASIPLSPAPVQSPAVSTPTIEKKTPRIPTKISDNKPLPTLPEPQAAGLSNDEYQTIAASAVLASSLERSRVKWTVDGVFERYWTKPESGKNAKPPPPNNPEAKWMKHKGECRIRVEPHIFKCEMYVEEKPVPKQYPPPTAFTTQPYRPPQQQHPQYGQQYQQARVLPPINQQQQGRTLPPINPAGAPSISPAPPVRAPQAQPQPPQSEKKAATPDPVISALAARASSDPQLKALMKEVAQGNASQDQLKVFQRHIDELQASIKKQKQREEEEQKRQTPATAASAPAVDSDPIQYDGSRDAKPAAPGPSPFQQQRPPPTSQPVAPPYPSQPAPQQQTWTPPAPPAPPEHPVLLQFVVPGATDDRFLFPRHSIIESLSAQHLLASFLVTRKGREAADPTNLDPDKEYYAPVTIMLECPMGSEKLLEHVKKWVKPADVVKKHMEDVMKGATRAPETHLALRLPFKGSAAAAEMEELTSKEVTPMVTVESERPKPKSSVKFVKRASTGKNQDGGGGAEKAGEAPATAVKLDTVEAEKAQKDAASAAANGAAEKKKGEEVGIVESGRPKRAVRQSSRISEAA